jgi:hypothetical protein
MNLEQHLSGHPARLDPAMGSRGISQIEGRGDGHFELPRLHRLVVIRASTFAQPGRLNCQETPKRSFTQPKRLLKP